MDYFFRDPRTGAAIVTELKGIDLEALTANQKIYVPLFEGEGATIRITSRRGGKARLQVRDLLKIRGENFLRIARSNLKAFADALEQITTGGQVKYSWRDARRTALLQNRSGIRRLSGDEERCPRQAAASSRRAIRSAPGPSA